ncbi:GntR family transcriptional regulator [Shimazuella kribbensis]|uniref:GntR family transcriptional regulator n=1 Tax=Shimazuella kribbensis TaxID=139808 RepID=UPI0003FE6039|nr:GntR family transcriptional regulator [Shimazuella kribbensis]
MEKSKINEVVSELRNQIKDKYIAGQRLPSERALSKELNASRGTIRAALQRLQQENYIDILPNSGAFVRFPVQKMTMGNVDPLPKNSGPELQEVGSFIHLAREQGREVSIRYLEPSKVIPAEIEISRKMGIKPDDEVFKRYRIQVVDRIPYRILTTYLLGSLTKELKGQEDHKIPLFDWLRDNKDLNASEVTESLNCRMPNEQECSLLNISRTQPVVEMDRWIWGIDRKGKKILFEYSKIIANSSLHDFTYTYSINKKAIS